jgi:hypothetical protein
LLHGTSLLHRKLSIIGTLLQGQRRCRRAILEKPSDR